MGAGFGPQVQSSRQGRALSIARFRPPGQPQGRKPTARRGGWISARHAAGTAAPEDAVPWSQPLRGSCGTRLRLPPSLAAGGSFGFAEACFLAAAFLAAGLRGSSFFGLTGTSSAKASSFSRLSPPSFVADRHAHRAALLSLPNSTSSASGFLTCSWMTRPSGRAPMRSS